MTLGGGAPLLSKGKKRDATLKGEVWSEMMARARDPLECQFFVVKNADSFRRSAIVESEEKKRRALLAA